MKCKFNFVNFIYYLLFSKFYNSFWILNSTLDFNIFLITFIILFCHNVHTKENPSMMHNLVECLLLIIYWCK
jgi:uncharacterized membrane protein YGL010W